MEQRASTAHIVRQRYMPGRARYVVTSRLDDVTYNQSSHEVIFYLHDEYRETIAGLQPLVLFWYPTSSAEGGSVETKYKGEHTTFFEWTYFPNRELVKLPEMSDFDSCIIL